MSRSVQQATNPTLILDEGDITLWAREDKAKNIHWLRKYMSRSVQQGTNPTLIIGEDQKILRSVRQKAQRTIIAGWGDVTICRTGHKPSINHWWKGTLYSDWYCTKSTLISGGGGYIPRFLKQHKLNAKQRWKGYHSLYKRAQTQCLLLIKGAGPKRAQT